MKREKNANAAALAVAIDAMLRRIDELGEIQRDLADSPDESEELFRQIAELTTALVQLQKLEEYYNEL